MITPKQFLLRRPYNHMPAGTKLYEALKHDYGLAKDDTRTYEREYVSVTRNEDGDYPLFTIPKSLLEEVKS